MQRNVAAVVHDTIALALNRATIIARAMKPFPVRVGWKTRAFDTPGDRADYEMAFVCWPQPCLEATPAARMGWLDAEKTAEWRRDAQRERAAEEANQ